MRRAVLAGALAAGALTACIRPLPPFQGPSPVPIPWVAPAQLCEHTILPGVRYLLTVPQKGVWNFEWQDSLGNWHTGVPVWLEAGHAFYYDSFFPNRIAWSPEAKPGSPWYVVSPVFVPYPMPTTKCPGG